MLNTFEPTSTNNEVLQGTISSGRRAIDTGEIGAGDVLIPLIRAAATIGFAIAPCSLGFVIIAVSEQLIHSIMVGDDPEMLVSDLQNQFPNNIIEIIENDDVGLVAKVVDAIERPDPAHVLNDRARCYAHGAL